ncbi:Hypothetical predicted protein [Mytilus galloprovincialis]|uniref:Integrase catalytic domain-containing protein n=1 Tax=Mytilus galloprovincialis TaxID=29158 RepID=A0A8B6BSQ0_MYTGA|nr:Hypothetical predicted protein [Mytilus galloprovincialis]
MQTQDTELGDVLKLKLDSADKPTFENFTSKSTLFKNWIQKWELLTVQDDILCYYWEDQTGTKRWKICTPKALQGYVLWHLHDSPTGGHQGINRTKKRAALCPFFWPHMNRNIQDYVTTCDICPLPTTDQGNRYILVIQDYFTKFTEVYPLCDINAETVANVFLKGWIKRYGCPVEIHSDQGTQYESQLFQGICKLLHISKTRTTAMHPRSDGMVERGNRTIKEMLSKYIDRNQSDWDKYIDYMVMAYNSTPHDSTGITPYRMMFGDEMKMPLDLIAGSPSDDDEETHFKNEHSFVAKIREELEKAHEIAREKLKRTAIRQKDYYDRNVKEINYANGDLVRRWQPHVVKGGKKKLYRNWTGPWVIIEKLTDVLFKIKHSKNSPNVVVHADNLKKYTGVKSVSWFKPEKTILHAQPPLINYFDSEHELRVMVHWKIRMTPSRPSYNPMNIKQMKHWNRRKIVCIKHWNRRTVTQI